MHCPAYRECTMMHLGIPIPNSDFGNGYSFGIAPSVLGIISYHILMYCEKKSDITTLTFHEILYSIGPQKKALAIDIKFAKSYFSQIKSLFCKM
jgi:hypothetical protein